MVRFTLSQLLMGIALVAIVLAFTQTEGCGYRFTMVESLSFTADDARLAVAKLNARDAEVPMKGYKADLARTISWLNTSAGTSEGIMREDFVPGDHGPAWQYYRTGRTSALCSPANDHVAMSAFGGGNVTCDIDTATPVVVPLKHLANQLAYSKTGRLLAASGGYWLTVLDTRDNRTVMYVESDDVPFARASFMAFTSDEAQIVVADDKGVHVWDLATSKQSSTIAQGQWVTAIATCPDNTAIICCNGWVRRYDFAGQRIATLAGEGHNLCSVSRDGGKLAISDGEQLTIFDLASNEAVQSLPAHGATSLALSSDGGLLAVGDHYGYVTLLDTATGTTGWRTDPPHRYRWPWTAPAVFLVGWMIVAWRLSKRRRKSVADAPRA